MTRSILEYPWDPATAVREIMEGAGFFDHPPQGDVPFVTGRMIEAGILAMSRLGLPTSLGQARYLVEAIYKEMEKAK